MEDIQTFINNLSIDTLNNQKDHIIQQLLLLIKLNWEIKFKIFIINCQKLENNNGLMRLIHKNKWYNNNKKLWKIIL